MKKTLASWEPQARSIARIILAFLVSLHAFRLAFGLFPQMAGRRGAPGMPLDLLPQIIAYAAIVAGVLVMAGLFTRPAALVLSLQSLAAYIFIAAPRALEPIRAGANEIILYFLFFLFIALDGPGSWSLDHRRAIWPGPTDGNVFTENKALRHAEVSPKLRKKCGILAFCGDCAGFLEAQLFGSTKATRASEKAFNPTHEA